MPEILEKHSAKFIRGSIHYRISASIGLAACNGGDGNTYSSLFEKADHAMYRTKQGAKMDMRLPVQKMWE